MSDVIIPQRWKARGGTSANLASVNETPLDREIIVETDTGRMKLGDGVTAYNSLPYVGSGEIDFTGVSEGRVLAWNATSQRLEFVDAGGGGGGADDSFATAYEAWDFIRRGVTTSTASGTAFVTGSAVPVVYVGNGGAASMLTESGAPGIVRLSTGVTAANGYARLFLTPEPNIILGSGEVTYRARIRIPTLSEATQRFDVLVAAVNVISGAPQRLCALYRDDFNSGQWQLQAIDSVSTATENTAISVVANTWMSVKLVVNAAGTSAELFIDGVSAGVVASNIPAVAVGIGVWIDKAVGTAARIIDVDVADFKQVFATSR